MEMPDAIFGMFEHVGEGYIGITTFQDGPRETKFFPVSKLEEALIYAFEQNKQRKNVHFAVKSFSDVPTMGRGKANDAGYHGFVWLDLDYGVDGHKSTENPPTREDALALLRSFVLPPSMIIFTGHGLQAFWFFDVPIDATNEEGRRLASNVVKSLQSTFTELAAKKGWQVDKTSDLARLMRVPGTVNWKDPNKPVQGRILEYSPDRRYSVEEILAACPHKESPQAIRQSRAKNDCQATAAESAIIPVSRRNATLTSLAGTMRRRGMSGEAIQAALLEENTKRCEEPLDDAEVEAIARSVTRYEPGESDADRTAGAEAVVDGMLPQIALDPSQVFSPEAIQALAFLMLGDSAAYCKAKMKLKKVAKNSLPLKELEMAVRGAARALRESRRTALQEDANEKVFDRLRYDLKIPQGYAMTSDGVFLKGRDADQLIFPAPVTLARRFRNPHSGLEMVELIFRYRDAERRVAAERSVVFSRHKIMELADSGLPVTSENAKALVVYLSEVERINEIPLVDCAARLGWIGDGAILPWDAAAAYLDARGFEETVAGFGEKGTLQEWIALTAPVRASMPGRTLLAASYASPMVSLVGARTSGVMLWGGSQAGKTAALKAAVSIYGHPEKLMLNMYATRVSLEQQASFLHNLPVSIDERQLAGNDQALEQLVYMLSGGAGKGRGRKNGGVQARGNWENLALITGEFPISSDSSAAGVRGRLLEINVTKVVDNAAGVRLHRELPKQYGTAGLVFIGALKNNAAAIRQRYDEWLNRTTHAFAAISGSHAALLALLGLADEIASVAVHGEDAEAAAKSAWNFVQAIAAHVVTTAEMDDAERAKKWVISRYVENAHKFEAEENRPGYEFGAMLCGVLQIAPSVLSRFLREGGFNVARSRADFAQRGWLKQFLERDGRLTDQNYGKCAGHGADKRGYWNYLVFPEWAPTAEEQDQLGIAPPIPPEAVN